MKNLNPNVVVQTKKPTLSIQETVLPANIYEIPAHTGKAARILPDPWEASIFSFEQKTDVQKTWRAGIQFDYRKKGDDSKWIVTISDTDIQRSLVSLSPERLGDLSVDDTLPLQKHMRHIVEKRLPNEWDHILMG